MTAWSRKALLVLALLAVMVLPLPGSLIHWGGLPPGFGVFPPQQFRSAPGFNLAYFIFSCAVAVGVSSFFLLPRLFGFRLVQVAATPVAPKPWWFWAGFAGSAMCVALMWFAPPAVAGWMFVPAWWCFIVGLDGWSYARNNGRSPMTTRRRELLAQTALSVPGWYLFEYLNFFAPGNWYYPFASLQPRWVSVAWFTLSYTTVWPAVAEWYSILESFPALKGRWADGPKLAFSSRSQVWLLVAGAGAYASFGVVPNLTFWMLWLGPLVIFSLALTLTGVWTPYRRVASGDWSGVLLAALAAVATSISWESWNFGSEFFRGHQPSNPNFWIYDIPYVNVGHVFSEMPFLGYFGYLPFGVTCWLWWLLCRQVLDLRMEAELGVRTASGEPLPAPELGAPVGLGLATEGQVEKAY